MDGNMSVLETIAATHGTIAATYGCGHAAAKHELACC